MRVDEYAAYDATGLAELVRRGEITASEAYAAAAEAVAAVNIQLNAVADGPWERCPYDPADGPFQGVPFVAKDLGCHPRGVAIRSGTRLSGDGVVFSHESFLMARFREAGMPMVALSTTPEFGLNASTEAVVYGATRNPWDLSRSARGSSGGSAALVAAGAVPVGHGGDGGGSIRIPASFNGLVGLKPSRGRVSYGPDQQEALSGLAAEFVLTRTLRDCAAMLDAVAGPMPGDSVTVKEAARAWVQELGAPGALRVAVHTNSWAGTPVDAELAAAVETVASELVELGHHVDRAGPSFDWDAFLSANVAIWAATCAESVETVSAATGVEPGPDTLEHTTFACWEYGRAMRALELQAAKRIVNEVARKVGDFFTRWDLLVTPTTNVPAFPLGYLDAGDESLDAPAWLRRVFDVCSFTPIFNWTRTPALSLPLGWTSHSLPIGVQLAAPMGDEAVLMQVGSQLEQAMPWRRRRPGVHATKLPADRWSTPPRPEGHQVLLRGIEHIGVTVPDVVEATRYFEEAFGARLLYDHMPLGSDPWFGAAAEQLLGVPSDAQLLAVRMLYMPDGPSIELFQYTAEDQRSSSRPCDLGLQHVAFYTDDIDAACGRITAAGGEVLAGPRDFQLELEAGPGNKWCYTRAPWGMTIELTTFPSPQGYERHTVARRWKPKRRR